jgi:hypothetical protein
LDALNEVAARNLRGLAVPAVVALAKLVSKPEHPDHRKAVEMVLNRTGHAERAQVDVNVSGQVEHVTNRTDAALDSLEYLVSMQVPREKLIDTFGYSGLARYERMLEDRQRKQGKSLPAPAGHRNGEPAVIEGEFSEVKANGRGDSVCEG